MLLGIIVATNGIQGLNLSLTMKIFVVRSTWLTLYLLILTKYRLPLSLGANTMWYLQFQQVCAKLMLSRSFGVVPPLNCLRWSAKQLSGGILRNVQNYKFYRTPRLSGIFTRLPLRASSNTKRASHLDTALSSLFSSFNHLSILKSTFFSSNSHQVRF